jgi:hypothetical protein
MGYQRVWPDEVPHKDKLTLAVVTRRITEVKAVMKESFYLALGLWLLVVGCLKPLPSETTPVMIVEIKPLPPTKVYGEIVSVEIIESPIKTWLSKEEIEEKRLQQKNPCAKGDPLCDVIP